MWEKRKKRRKKRNLDSTKEDLPRDVGVVAATKKQISSHSKGFSITRCE